MLVNKTKIRVLDNGGETLDRYTIIILKDDTTIKGDMYGASVNPFNPQGFGSYAGNIANNYWFHAYGAAWRRNCSEDTSLLKRRINYAITLFFADCKHVGKEVKTFKELPKDVQKYIKQLTT